MYDLLIIGSGPAALTAAIYAARSELKTVVFERHKLGGALPEIATIGNFPGFLGPGRDLAKSMSEQARSFGAAIKYGEVEKLEAADGHFRLVVDGETVEAKTVLLATGSEPIPLPFTPTSPVSYCALCDATLYKEKNILVIGGGNSAVGESLMLAEIVGRLTIMTHSALKAEQSRVDRLKSLPNVQILEHTEPSPENTKDYDGIFVYIGKRPATHLLQPDQLDADGYAKTLPGTHQIAGGLFAAGDVRSGTTKQAIVAAGDGAAAAVEIIKFLQGQK